jgi:hypothetical protein
MSYKEDAEIINLIQGITTRDSQISLCEEINKRKPMLSVYLMAEKGDYPSKELVKALNELGKIKIANSKNIYLNNF